RANI
ncbi:hypothetical protein, partial [Achromobacter phage kwar_LB4]